MPFPFKPPDTLLVIIANPPASSATVRRTGNNSKNSRGSALRATGKMFEPCRDARAVAGVRPRENARRHLISERKEDE
jgi:hypothetical protein